MKFSSIAAGALLAVPSLAAPANYFNELAKRQGNIDLTILQFALTLEHLENVFYKQALKNFTAQDFEAAGYGPNYYNNLNYIAHDEETHVVFLSTAITAAGASPVQACTYAFPYTDVVSFITLSSILEGVGTSAYLAGAPLITNKNYLTAAGSILVVEALHTSMQRSAINEVPEANPFGTPLDPTSVYTLAANFIVSCPASNAPLPFVPFPALTVDASVCTCEEPTCDVELAKRDGWSGSGSPCKPGNGGGNSRDCSPAKAGAPVKLTAASKIPAGSFVTFVSGLSVVSVPGTIDADGVDITAVIPSIAQGQTYVFITSSDVEGTFSDSAVLFGPAVLEVYPPPPSIDYTIL